MATITTRGKTVLAALAVICAVMGIYKVRNRIAPPRPSTQAVQVGSFGATVAPHGTDAGRDGLGRPLRVAINTWPGYAPGILENGNRLTPSPNSPFARDHGIQVELVLIDDYAQSRDAFRSGRVDVLWATVDSFALEAPGMASTHPRAFLQFDYSHGGDAIAATANIRQASDLRGKRVAYAAGTPSQYLLLYVLTNAGLSMSDIIPVETASAPEAATMFRAGNVDAAVSWDPDVTTAARNRTGGHILTSTVQADHLIADVFYANQDFLMAHTDTLARFSAGWFDGVRAVVRDPSAGARALASGLTGIPLEDATAMLPNAHLTGYWDNRKFFGLDGGDQVTFDTIFHNASGIWRGTGQLSQVAQAADHFAVAPLEEIRDREFSLQPPPVVTPRVYVTGSDGGAPQTPILTRRLALYFPTGSALIDGNAQFAIERISDLAASFGGARMRVVGNTDNTGNPEANRRLSQARAQAIVTWLVTNGHFDPTKFEVVGAGSDNPVATNTTPEGRAQNRRTDFEVIPESGTR